MSWWRAPMELISCARLRVDPDIEVNLLLSEMAIA